MVLVAVAGPAMNIALAIAAALSFHLAVYLPGTIAQWVVLNLKNALIINVILAVFNLFPLPPLDGGRIAVGLLPNVLARQLARLEPYGMIILIGLLILLPLLGSQMGMLGSLLGDRDQAALASAVGKYSGVGTAAGSSLLAGLGPLVMGAIAQQQGPRALDGGSIAGLLAGQKDNIAAAIPSGFGKLLGGTGLFNTIDDATRRTAAAGAEATRAAAASVSRTIDDTRRSATTAASTGTNWLIWAIPALAIAALLVWLLGRPTEQVVQQSTTALQSLTVGGLDLGKQVTDSIGTLRSTLAGITDAASAQTALPKLQAATAQIDKVGGMIGQLSDPQRRALAGMVLPVMPALNSLFDKVLSIPGVADVIKPTIDTLKTKLAILTA